MPYNNIHKRMSCVCDWKRYTFECYTNGDALYQDHLWFTTADDRKYNKLSTATNDEAEEITMLSVIPPLDFPLSFSTHYYVSWSTSPAHGNFTMQRHWTMTFNPYYFFVLFCYLLPFVVLVFTSGVSWLCTWYFYHGTALDYNGHSYCFCFRLAIY